MADGIKKVSENVIVDRRALVITDPTVKDNDAISIGALQSNPSTRGLKIKTAKNAGGKEILLPEEALEKLNRYLLELSMDWFKNTKGEADWKVYKENGQIIIKPAAAKKKS